MTGPAHAGRLTAREFRAVARWVRAWCARWPLAPLDPAWSGEECRCACAEAHAGELVACEYLNAVVTRDVRGRAAPMCGPCAAWHDKNGGPAL